MAIPKIKATYSLGEPTVKKLGEIARKWNTSKSDALERLISESPETTPEEEIQRKLQALKDYQQSMSHLTTKQIDQWIRESDEIRHSWVSPWEDAAQDSE